jgi:hypothetical protein
MVSLLGILREILVPILGSIVLCSGPGCSLPCPSFRFCCGEALSPRSKKPARGVAAAGLVHFR